MNSENFIITKEYKKFEEFCEACRRYKYIGLCYVQPVLHESTLAKL